jgi:hypothetical protein
MDLDELREKWAEHDRKLDAILRLNRQLLSATNLNRARSALQRLTLGLALESAITFAAIVALGAFNYEHIATLRFALPAAALDLVAIAYLIDLVRQITAAVRIDYGRPIAAIQRQLEALRVLRIRSIRRALMAGMLAWTPFVIVAFKGFLDVDVYRSFDTAWLAANALFSVAVVSLAIWVSKRFGDRMGRSPFIQQLMRDLAGHNLNAAAEFLATLSEFEDEERDR